MKSAVYRCPRRAIARAEHIGDTRTSGRHEPSARPLGTRYPADDSSVQSAWAQFANYRGDRRIVTNTLARQVARHHQFHSPADSVPDNILCGAALFRAVDPAEVAELTERLPRVDFSAQQTVYVEGESADRLYIILSGKSRSPAVVPTAVRTCWRSWGRRKCSVTFRSSIRDRAPRPRPP